MRSALSHARDCLCFGGAIALILYITLVPQRPADAPFVARIDTPDSLPHDGATPWLFAGTERLAAEAGR